MTVLMQNSQKKILQFPKPPEQHVTSPIVVQIGSERFAIHYEIEDLLPIAPSPPVVLKVPAKKPTK